ncbi:MAG: metalloregulator ArsR/SmtB family transcription factor [Alphaproteobacteria bacterium]|uniref:ArsR/SmtB family transcription factor n=1 Tax=Brevundimonas sp. TaxID=1871086 RepID=UPI0017C9553F|nr:metalloregulator ArsR/SmtB family transcription factor [Brevundimonas sp.]MBA3049620.1 winged helix-turn-helix transcriptional regulator [Brevundimonas sp.]MBU3972789.1 metalloregulator ArsR/SmtB family transcription factor [Alphaproteobacteria bacterium]MBU4038675.1 metalloregulator ArsR/SmtB family transcription factor [Alphaproteobacteria bacterium]MBU4137101.1 metalloregulator ArsR/SmtB family transcription factor [Alphaproteobacteria bacterium]
MSRVIPTPDPAALAELEASAAPAARLMRLFANEQRLMLMCRLSEGDCPVGELAAFVGLSQSACSQHLARLREEGVIAPRRDAQTIYYGIADAAAARVIALLCDIYRNKSDGDGE